MKINQYYSKIYSVGLPGSALYFFKELMDTVKLLSIVVPCYNEQEVLPLFYDKITEVMDGMKTENP